LALYTLYLNTEQKLKKKLLNLKVNYKGENMDLESLKVIKEVFEEELANPKTVARIYADETYKNFMKAQYEALTELIEAREDLNRQIENIMR
jgi:hypothetical protein